ncbi:MAG: hypothetical protein QOD30_1528, partial [Actinomycetota bacterium]|nr:hypothetical protein [Actinomycetota bacterium]
MVTLGRRGKVGQHDDALEGGFTLVELMV